uniref:Endothelial cell adhesion molecule b n=1 Tax=Mastacembelus armatus TaxID=205130 RepID=A0A3Q3MZQ1_9TELE
MPRSEMEVVRGQMVVLHAWYSHAAVFSKMFFPMQVINFSSGEVGHGQNEFTKRVGFSVAMPSTNLSIYINNTQESDSGRYVCNVIVPGGAGISGEMRLNVKVPPSPPVCTMTGNPVVKGNVTLSCKSSHGKPAPQYKWTKAAPMSEVFFSPMQSEYYLDETLIINPFIHLTKNTDFLVLSRFLRVHWSSTLSMSGKYVCRASNTAGSDSCSINLEVITCTYTFLFYSTSHRDIQQEDAQAPKRVSWAKSNTGSDIVSKNGTLSSIATSPQPREPHQPNFHYPYSPISTSDTGSVINAYQLRPGEASTLQGLPGYNMGGTPSRKHKRPSSTNGAPPQVVRSPVVTIPNKTEGAQPQVAPPLTVSPKISSSTLTRMGAVAVMVPAQSQAGSLV